ncbi:MAG: hypothetical protein QXZ66_10510 [Thermoproteota archaeon]|nr:hypothetical protein [Candidatus Brockarchaeota archaeon]
MNVLTDIAARGIYLKTAIAMAIHGIVLIRYVAQIKKYLCDPGQEPSQTTFFVRLR